MDNKEIQRERAKRILARGEHSGHSHVALGEGLKIIERNGVMYIQVPQETTDAKIAHIREADFLATGAEVWTTEHHVIPLPPGRTYQYVPQVEQHPYEETIRRVAD